MARPIRRGSNRSHGGNDGNRVGHLWRAGVCRGGDFYSTLLWQHHDNSDKAYHRVWRRRIGRGRQITNVATCIASGDQ